MKNLINDHLDLSLSDSEFNNEFNKISDEEYESNKDSDSGEN